jgi:hypothetical protein
LILNGYSTINKELEEFHEYNFITHEWKEIKSKNGIKFPKSRYHCSIIIKDKLYAINGENKLYIYNIEENIWSFCEINGSVPSSIRCMTFVDDNKCS